MKNFTEHRRTHACYFVCSTVFCVQLPCLMLENLWRSFSQSHESKRFRKPRRCRNISIIIIIFLLLLLDFVSVCASFYFFRNEKKKKPRKGLAICAENGKSSGERGKIKFLFFSCLLKYFRIKTRGFECPARAHIAAVEEDMFRTVLGVPIWTSGPPKK